MSGGPTLTEVLAARGYTHRRTEGGPAGAHDVMDADGVVVVTGRAHEVWAWLRRAHVAEANALVDECFDGLRQANEFFIGNRSGDDRAWQDGGDLLGDAVGKLAEAARKLAEALDIAGAAP